MKIKEWTELARITGELEGCAKAIETTNGEINWKSLASSLRDMSKTLDEIGRGIVPEETKHNYVPKTLHEEIEAILQDAAVEHFRIPHHTEQLEQAITAAIKRAKPPESQLDSFERYQALDEYEANLLKEISAEEKT